MSKKFSVSDSQRVSTDKHLPPLRSNPTAVRCPANSYVLKCSSWDLQEGHSTHKVMNICLIFKNESPLAADRTKNACS